MADRKTTIKSSQIFNNGVKLEDLNDEAKIASIGFILDNGSNVIETGIGGNVEIPFDCELLEVTLLADQTGSIVIDILKGTYADYPQTTSITASAKPTISSGIKVKDSTLSGWTISLTAGDTLRFSVDSCTNITQCTISLKIKKT